MKKLLVILFLIPTILIGQNVSIRQAEKKEEGFRLPTIFIPIGKVVERAVTSGDFWFYPENLSWIDTRNGTVKQGAFLPSSVFYIEINDVKLNLGLKRVVRIVDGFEVEEDRVVSMYEVIVHGNNGEVINLGNEVKIITNNDANGPVVPGTRWTFKAAIDDPHHVFGTGDYSQDGGLSLDFD